MDKKKLSRIFGWVALAMVIVFLLALIRDAVVYNITLNSAPFSLWVLVDALSYLVPALICFIAYRYLKKKI